jgi:class 3 adenylate cyclase
MAAFEGPVDALAFARAVAAAFAKRGLRLRTGMDAGRVEIIDGEVVGESVMVAAARCRRAEAGQVLATTALYELLGRAAAHPVGPCAPRSLRRTVDVIALQAT